MATENWNPMDALMKGLTGDAHRILIIGGGAIGMACYRLLAAKHEVKILEVDENHQHKDHPDFITGFSIFDKPLEKLPVINWVKTHEGDGSTTHHSKHFAPQYIINTAPNYNVDHVLALLDTCVVNNIHYLDFSEDVRVADHIKTYCEELSDKVHSLVAPGCGLAPGIISIIANTLAEMFDEVEGIEMYVGALPASSANPPYNYLTTWSPEGVINEYSKPAEIIIAGQRQRHQPLNFSTDVMIDGTQYESFLTSGGSGTMLDTWEGKAQRVIYRTVRYPGHLAAVLRHVDYNKSAPSKGGHEVTFEPTFLKWLKTYRPITLVDDTVVLLAAVYGKLNDEDRYAQFSAQVHNDTEHELSAIQRLTAGGACSILDLHSRGLIKKTGHLKQEEVSHETLQKSVFWPILGL